MADKAFVKDVPKLCADYHEHDISIRQADGHADPPFHQTVTVQVAAGDKHKPGKCETIPAHLKLSAFSQAAQDAYELFHEEAVLLGVAKLEAEGKIA